MLTSTSLTIPMGYNGIMFTHDPKSAKVSKGFESPNLQGRVNSPGSSILIGAWARTSRTDRLRCKSWNSSSRFGSGSSDGCVPIPIPIYSWLVWEMFASVEHVLMALIEVDGYDEHWGSIVRLCWSKVSFHQALDLILELDEAAVGCTQDILRQRFFGVPVTKLTIDRLVNSSSCDGIDMVIKDGLGAKGTSGYRCRVLWSFPVEIIEQGNKRILSLFSPSRSSESASFRKSLRELDGIPVALVARFGVVSKSADRILVSYGGSKEWVTKHLTQRKD
ncbi:hypothetical protein Tco_0206739 [Tanacetum coccineum]